VSKLVAGCCGGLIIALAVTLLLWPSYYAAYGSYWASGRAAHSGANPYATFPETFRSRAHDGTIIDDINLNPPCALPAMSALSRLNLRPFGITWMTWTAMLSTRLRLLCRFDVPFSSRSEVQALFSPPEKVCESFLPSGLQHEMSIATRV